MFGNQKDCNGRITKWKPNTKRSRGRSRQMWADGIHEGFKLPGLRNAEESAKDRGKWRQYVVATMSA